MRAWNPLHIPSIRPSLFLRRSITASLSIGFLNTEVMNFPEPSGSSPALNPPGIAIICDSLILSAICFIDSSILILLKFLNTNISASPPALSKTFAVSYSQFVPGNTGINTFGFAIPPFPFITLPAVYSNFLTSPSISSFAGKTLSRGFIQASIISSSSISTQFILIISSSIVFPIFICSRPSR